MSKPPPYFPFYPTDFASSGKVEAMTTEEIGAYILLLGKAWHESPPCSIPNDDRILARWTRLGDERWSLARAAVLACFDRREDGRLYQPRLDREWRAMVERQRARSAIGKLGGRASANRRSTDGSADGSPTVNLSSSSSPPYSKPPPAPPVSLPESGGGAGGGVPTLTDEQAACYRLIVERPAWLPEGEPWIDGEKARDIAALPTTTQALIAHYARETRQKRKHLDRPGGYLVSKLSKPDAGVVASIAAHAQTRTVSEIHERATQNGVTP